ncbi:hypothetical protein ACHAXM_001010 [Skeletonema potamos]
MKADDNGSTGIGTKRQRMSPPTSGSAAINLFLSTDLGQRISSLGSYFFSSFTRCTMKLVDEEEDANVVGVNKRQRISPLIPAATINDLSADLWCGIADFLPKTSRALLAVALTAPPASFRKNCWKGQPNAVSRAIISATKARASFDSLLDELCEDARGETGIDGKRRSLKRYTSQENYDRHFRELLSKQIKEYYESQWDIIDFIDIPLSLVSLLTDDDIGAILVCIGETHSLKRLKLTNCINVVGQGLEPLQSSTVLEKLDLGLCRDFERPFWRRPADSFRETKLSEGAVCDILDSMLRNGESSLRRLQYPCEWYDENAEDNIMNDMDQIMRSRRLSEFVKVHNAVANKFSSCVYFGFDGNDGFLSSMNDGDVWGSDPVDTCTFCGVNDFALCSHCNEIFCNVCYEPFECSVCHVRHCPRCENDGLEDVVTYCLGGNCEPYCSECRLISCREGTNDCNYCKGLIFDALLEECHVQQAQINSQQEEMERSKSIMFTSEYPPITIRIKDMT